MKTPASKADEPERVGRLFDRLLRVVGNTGRVVDGRTDSARGGSGGSRGRSWALGTAGAVFAIASVIGILRLPPVQTEVRYWLIGLVPLVGVPLTAATNALEYQVTAAVAGHRVGFLPSLRVAILSTAANMLPIPGALVVRTKALRDAGASVGGAVTVTGLIGIVWIGVTFVMVGAVQALFNRAPVGWGVAVAGLGVTILGLGLLSRRPRTTANRFLLIAVVAVEAAGVTISGLRFLCVLWGLGYDVSLAQALALTVASVLASTTGFFPGGLGIRELLAGIVSPAVGLPSALGVIASSVDRLSGLGMLAMLSVGLAMVGGMVGPHRASRKS